MNVIRFSHKYLKMLNNRYGVPKKAILMEVFKDKSENLHEKFVEYDTAYYDDDKEIKFFQLPKGDVLILLLKSGDMIWTTIRRWTQGKENYYRDNRWNEFIIEIKKLEKI